MSNLALPAKEPTNAGNIMNLVAQKPKAVEKARQTDKPQDKGQTEDVGSEFRALIEKMAEKRGQRVDAPANAEIQLPAEMQGIEISPELLAQIKVGDQGQLLLNDQPLQLSPELLAQIAALMQQVPALQTVLAGKVDLKAVAEALESIQQGVTPDLKALNLPADVQDALVKLAEKPDLLSKVKDMVQQLQAQPTLAAALAQVDLPKLVAEFRQKAQPQFQEAVAQPAAQAKVQENIAEPEAKAPVLAEAMAAKPMQEDVLPKAAAPRPAKVEAPATNVLAEARQMMQHAPQSAAVSGQTGAEAGARVASVGVDVANANAPAAAAPVFQPTLLDAAQTAGQNLQNAKVSLLNASTAEIYVAQAARNAAPTAHTAAMQVAVQIQREAAMGRNKGFFIQLQPEDMGRIEVNLKFDGVKMRATIAAEKEETLAMLKQDSGALVKALQGSGIQTDAGSLEFSLGQNFNNFHAAHGNQRRDAGFGTMLANNPADETHINSTVTHIAVLEPGRVDVKL